MKSSNLMRTQILLGVALTCAGGVHAQQPAAPVPLTNDTPAATTKPMPPETTPVQEGAAGTAPSSAPMTKDQMKAQRNEQKAEEKAANANAKAAKSAAKAKKQSDKAIQDQEKASPATTAPAPSAQ